MVNATGDRENLDGRRRDQVGRGRETEQDEGELAALGQDGPDLGGHPVREPRALSGKGGEQHALEQDKSGRDQHDGPRCWTAIPDVHGHADRHEEEAEQQPADRPDVGGDLMAIIGVGDHKAGDERAELERQARLLGDEA